MAKKKKDPLAAAARQVVKDTANKAVKQTAKPNVKKQQPKQSSRNRVTQSAKNVSNIARNTMRNAGESTKKATVSTAKALPKRKAKPFKASDLSGNTGRGVTKQARKQTKSAYTGASQRKAQAKQKEKDIKAGKFNVPNRLGQADEMMLSKEGKNQVNYWKDQWEKAKARGDKAGMQKAHEEAEKVRLTNPATVKTTTYEGPTQSQVTMAALQQYAQAMQAGDAEGMQQAKNLAAYAMLNVPKDNREQSYMTGAYSGGTWGDRALEASESDVLKKQGKNLLKSEGAAFASAVPEAAGGYIETVMNAPDIKGGSSQLVVKNPNVDKRTASQFELRGQSRYTEEDARAKADHYQAQAEYLKQIAYATTPLPGVVGKFAVDATAAAGGMGIDLAANTIVPGAGLVSMGARTFGSSVQQAKDYQKVNGTDGDPYADAKAYLYGAAIAGTEIASEKMFGGPFQKIYGRGFADAAVKGATKPTIGKTILKGLLEEGSEEVAADLAQWQAPRLYGGETETLPEMLRGAAYDFTLGAALGGLGGAVTAPGQVRAEKVQNLKKRMESAGYAKDDIDAAFQRMTVGDMEDLTDSPDSTLEAWVDTVIGRANKSSQNENQSLTGASGEQSSEQTFEGEQGAVAEGKTWKALRKRLRESGVNDERMLRLIRSKMSAEEMEEAANLRKNDFLEWRDRVTSPDYQPAPREEEPTENITAEELNVEEEDELSTISSAQINKLGDKLRELGVDSRAVARAISDDAVLEQLVNMDAEELRTWAEEQKAPAKPSNEEVSEMLREQEEMLAERREREPEPSTEGLSGDAAMVRAMAEYLGDAGRSTMIGRYDPNEIKSKRGDAERYVLETRLAYNAGFTGNQISRTTNRVISPETANRMYEAGVMDKQAVQEQRRRKQARAKFYNSNEAGLGRDVNGHYLDEYVENLARQSKENAEILESIDTVSKTFGTKVEFPGSIAVRNDKGKAVETAGGGYTDARILLGRGLKGDLAFTYGHELTHRMAEIDPAAYELFKKYVMSKPDSEARYSLIQAVYRKLERSIDHNKLVEEVCADFAGDMIDDAEMLEDFARMADQNVVQRFFQALRDIARKLTGREKAYVEKAIKVLDEAYKKEHGVSMSAEMKRERTADVKAVGQMYESSLKQARKMASRPASFNITQEDTDTKYSIKSIFNSAGLDVEQVDGKIVATKNKNPVTEVDMKMVRESGIGALITYARDETKVITAEEAETQLEGARDLLNMMLNAQDGNLVWRFAGSAMFSAVKSNSDGQYGTTIDFSTVCRKTQEMMTAMSDAMVRLGRGLTKDEVIELQYDILTEKGTVPCPVCYVFSRWAGVGGILDNMAKFQKKYGHEYDDPAKLQKAIDDLEKATKTKASLREMLREHDSVYMDLEQRVEEMQADNKAKKKEVKNLNKNKPDGYKAKVHELELAIRMNDGMITQAKEDLKKLEAEGAPELAWLKKVRSDPNYWNKEGGGYVDEKVLFNLDDAATFAEKYPIAWKYRTTRGPSAGKAILPYSDMRLGDLILGAGKNSAQGKETFKTVENGEFNNDQIKAIDRARQRTRAQNLIGGQRFQSTSDFRYDYGLDYLQVFWEAQALGTNMQTYTKIVEFAELAAAVGGDVNLSVMPLNNGLDENGNLLYSSVTGMDIEAAQKANEMYDNVQLILVGINDEHILTALDDESDHGGRFVGFVIPYHASGASINKFIRGLVENLRETFNENYYKDYSPVQEDSKKKIPGASEEVVKVWMEAMRENPSNPQFKGRKPNAKQRKALEQRLRHEIRAALLKHKIGGSSVAADKFINDNLEFFRGTSKDISGMSFEELRDIEQRALAGDADAIAEYESWSNGFLWDIYQKMWVDESAVDTYGVTLNTAQAGSVMPHEYWNKEVDREHAYINGFLFRSYCYNLGLTPRFTGINSAGKNVGYGDFSISKGYWKTLIDRPMYDNQGRYRDQQKINVTEITGEMLTPEYGEKKWGDYKVQEPDDKRARRAADRFVERKQNEANGEDMMYSIRSRDSEYLQAVRDGDMLTAQMLVDEASEAAGYTVEVYHGTRRFGFTEIDIGKSDDKISFFVTEDPATASTYSGTEERVIDQAFAEYYADDESGKKNIPGTYRLYMKPGNFLEVDARGNMWNNLSYRGLKTTREIAKYAFDNGYDGVHFLNVIDHAKYADVDPDPSDVYALFHPERQIKSADTITIDNEGNIIPLSERFNPDNPDIRWTLRGNRTYEELAEEYGIIPPGEKRAREARVPRQTTDEDRVSRAIRTIIEAQTTPEHILPRIEEMIANGEFSYNPITNKESVAKARATINELGYDEAWRKWSNDIDDRKASSDVVTLGWILYDDALKDGNVDKALEICAKMARFGSQLGQAVQALSILKRLPTELQMRMIPQPRPKHVQKKIDEYEEEEDDDEFDPLAPDEYDEETGLPKPKPKKPRKPREKKNPTQDEVDQMEKDTAEYQAKQSRFEGLLKMWNAWRYFAMLCNLRTHGRNILGNAGFMPVVMSKNLTATAAEIAVYYTVGKNRGMQRTKAFYAPNLFKFGWKDYEQVMNIILNEPKYEGTVADQEDGPFPGYLKPLNWAIEKNSNALNKEDIWFSKPHYANALSQYMAANGITERMMETGVGVFEKGPHKGKEFNQSYMNAAREYAVREAQKATYRDTNEISKMFMDLGKKRDNSKSQSFKHVMVEAVLPFKKTPANILVRAIEYSPAGFANGMTMLVYGVPKGKCTVAEALDSICAGMSGTGLFLVGMHLAKMGLLVAKMRGDDDEQYYFDKLLGHQQWAIEINDTSYTIDWLAPEIIPMFMGAQYWKSSSSDENIISKFNAITNSLSMVLDPVMELSCLSGIQDFFNDAARFAEGDVDTMTNMIAMLGLSYFSQGIPTLFGQFERAFQGPERMQTFTTDDPEQLLSADWQYQIGKISAKIPGWDYHQVPYVDSWGNTETETNTFKRIVANFLVPWYRKDIDTRPVNKELQRLYDVTGNPDVFPEPGWKTYRFKDDDGNSQIRYLNEEEYIAYSRAKGRENFELASKFINSPAYKNLSDADRAEILSKNYDYSEYKAQSENIIDFKGEPYTWIKNYQDFSNAVGGYDIGDFTIAKQSIEGVTGLKDPAHPEKNSFKNTTSANKKLAIYNSGVKIPQDPEYQKIYFEALDVNSKEVLGWNKAQCEDYIKKIRDKGYR